jgi:hypothetical protein
MESSAGDTRTFACEARTSTTPHHLGALDIIMDTSALLKKKMDTSAGFPLHSTQDPGVMLDAPVDMAQNLHLLGSSPNAES